MPVPTAAPGGFGQLGVTTRLPGQQTRAVLPHHLHGPALEQIARASHLRAARYARNACRSRWRHTKSTECGAAAARKSAGRCGLTVPRLGR